MRSSFTTTPGKFALREKISSTIRLPNESWLATHRAWLLEQLTTSLQELGPALETSRYTAYSPYPTHIRDLARYFRRMGRRNLLWVRSSMTSNPLFGGAALTLLALLGLLVQRWNTTRAFRELYLSSACVIHRYPSSCLASADFALRIP